MVKGPLPPTPVDRPHLPQVDPVVDVVPTDDPCAMARIVRVVSDPLALGSAVVAVPEGGRVAIFANNRPIGWLSDKDAATVRLCANRGWGYAGPVVGFDDGNLMIELQARRLT
jgi:hypothetical protein